MARLLVIAIIFLVSLPALPSQGIAETGKAAKNYESNINPSKFADWKKMKVITVCQFGYIIHVRNQGQGNIRDAMITVHPQYGLLSYAYVENNKVKVYGMNFKTGIYESQPVTKEQARKIRHMLVLLGGEGV